MGLRPVITRSGMIRNELYLGDWLFKFPSIGWGGRLRHFLMGWSWNLNESTWWQRAERDPELAEHRKILCPVYACWLFGLVLIMPRTEEIVPIERAPFIKEHGHLFRGVDGWRINRLFDHDTEDEVCRLVLQDYGNEGFSPDAGPELIT